MDGSEIVRTAVITGLDKLSRLQQRPLSHYYASMARDAMTADIIIYVIGYALGDLHINTWLAEARRMKSVPPLVFVGRWPNGFLCDSSVDYDRQKIEMLHALRMIVNHHYGGDEYGCGWTLAKDRTCAIWDKGFIDFLKMPCELDEVLTNLV